MPTPVYASVPVGDLLPLLAGRVGDRIAEGTASGGTTTTIVDTNQASGLVIFDTTDQVDITDKWATIYKGTNIGYSGRGDTYAPATVTLTVTPAASSAMGATSQYLIHERWAFREYLEALKEAQRRLTFDPRVGLGLMKEAIGRQIMIGNALANPIFDLYTTADAPDSWTTTSMTATQETTITYGGCRRSLKLVTDGVVVGNLNQALTEIGRWKGVGVTIWAWIYTTTASEVFLRCFDGVTTTNSSLHKGTGWEKLQISPTIGANASQITISVRTTTAATAVTFYVQVVRFPIAPAGDHVYSIDGDINLVVIDGTLKVSGRFSDNGGHAGDFDETLGPEAWELVYEATRKIRLKIGSGWQDRIVEYTGWKNHTAIASISTTWAGPIDPLLDLAAAILTMQKIAPSAVPTMARAGNPQGTTSYQQLEDLQKRTLKAGGVRPGVGWKQVEPII